MEDCHSNIYKYILDSSSFDNAYLIERRADITAAGCQHTPPECPPLTLSPCWPGSLAEAGRRRAGLHCYRHYYSLRCVRTPGT